MLREQRQRAEAQVLKNIAYRSWAKRFGSARCAHSAYSFLANLPFSVAVVRGVVGLFVCAVLRSAAHENAPQALEFFACPGRAKLTRTCISGFSALAGGWIV